MDKNIKIMGFVFNSSTNTGTGSTIITSASIITEITDVTNWDGSGDFTGSTTGLVAGNIYYDSNTDLKYEFDGTTLRRINFNTQI